MNLRHLLLASCSLLAGPARAHALDAVRDSIDDLPEELKSEYVAGADGKFVLQVTGMRPEAEFTRVQTALSAERRDHGALKTRIKEHFGDEKFEDIHARLDRIPELEAAQGTIDDDKINAIVEGRVRTKLAPVERERDQLK